MKVAIFCDTFAPQINGVSTTLKKLREYAGANEIEAIFLVPDYPENRQTETDVYRFSSFPLPFYKDCRIAVPPLFKAERILQRFRPDIIHAYSEFAISLAALRYARRHRIPIVSSYTSNFLTYLQYYHLDFLAPFLERYLSWFHNSCRVTFCPSQRTKEYLSQKNIRRTRIMKRGVDAEKFSPAHRSREFRRAAGAREDSVVFTYVGRISPEKDLDILAGCIRRIRARHGDRAVFVIVGDGPDRGRLQAELGPLAYFTGFLRGEELSRAYASSDVFVFPSTSETFGNVVLEAMCSGLPAVVPDAGGVTEIVTDGFDGFIVPPRSTEALTAAVETLLQNPLKIAELGRHALETARSRSWDSVFGQLFRSYGELAENNPNESNPVLVFE